MRPLFVLLFALLIPLLSFSQRNKRSPQQQYVQVSLMIKAPATGNSIYVTGDLPLLGPWIPNRLILFPSGDGNYIATFKAPKNTNFSLQFTQGDFDKVELDEFGEKKIHNYYTDRNLVIRHKIQRWSRNNSGSGRGQKEPVTVREYKPPPFQFVRNHPGLSAKAVSSRSLSVFLPNSYETETDKKYPVLYVINNHKTLNQFPDLGKQIQRWMNDGQVREGIIVVVNNPREYQLTHFNKSLYQPYRSFLASVVKPFIDESYRSYTDSYENTIMGSDLGGLLAFLTGWENTDVFGKVIALSPQFESERKYFSFAQKVAISSEYKSIELYFDNGKSNSEERRQVEIDRMLKALMAKGYAPRFNRSFSEQLSHSSVKERVLEALQAFF